MTAAKYHATTTDRLQTSRTLAFAAMPPSKKFQSIASRNNIVSFRESLPEQWFLTGSTIGLKRTRFTRLKIVVR